MNKSKGITLIALVVTIVIILILAGIVINEIRGEGLIAKAYMAKETSNKAQAEEELELALYDLRIEEKSTKYGLEGMTLSQKAIWLENELKKKDPNAKVTVSGEGFIVFYKNYVFNVDKYYNVISLEDLQEKYQFSYYSTFSKAIIDNNNNTKENADAQKEDAVAGIYEDENGNKTVMLLKDSSESEAITISKDVTINLAGKTLSLTTANSYLSFGEGVTVSINGMMEGSSIKAENLTTEGTYKMIQGSCEKFEVNGGTYLCNGMFKNVIAFSVKSKKFIANRAKILVETENAERCYGIQLPTASGESNIDNCQIEISGKDNVIGVNKFSSDKTIINNTGMKIISSNYWASGIRNSSTGEMLLTDSNVSVDGKEYVFGAFIQAGSNISMVNTKLSTKATKDIIALCSNGNGNINIENSEIEVNSNEAYVVRNIGGDVISSKNTKISVNTINTSYAFYNTDGSEITLVDNDIKVSSDENNAYGVYNEAGGNISITNTDIFADATDSDARGIAAFGILNCGTLTVNSGNVTGTHSGVQTMNGSKTYIYGGTFTSCCHGGMYFAQGSTGEAYVENATIICSDYSGKYTDKGGLHYKYGAFYIGGKTGSNSSVYMDNCTISGGKIVLRGTEGETGNKLYISNSTAEGVRIDDNQFLYVGVGTNITESSVTNSKLMEFTNKSYKK